MTNYQNEITSYTHDDDLTPETLQILVDKHNQSCEVDNES